MEGLTVSEIAKQLKIPVQTAARRIERAGIKPLTREAVFPFDTPDKIKAVKVGRPAKKPSDPKPTEASKRAKKP